MFRCRPSFTISFFMCLCRNCLTVLTALEVCLYFGTFAISFLSGIMYVLSTILYLYLGPSPGSLYVSMPSGMDLCSSVYLWHCPERSPFRLLPFLCEPLLLSR